MKLNKMVKPRRKVLWMRDGSVFADSEVANTCDTLLYNKNLATNLFRQKGQVLCEIDFLEGTQ